jgi:hypothetical protein
VANIFDRIKTLKDSDYDEKLVDFLKNYTINALKNGLVKEVVKKQMGNSVKGNSYFSGLMGGAKKAEVDVRTKYYDLGLFWHLFNKSEVVSIKIKDAASSALIEILK